MITTNKPIDGPIGGGGGTGGGGTSLGSGFSARPGSFVGGFAGLRPRRGRGFLGGFDNLPQSLFSPGGPPKPQVPGSFGNENSIMQNSVPGGGAVLGENYYPYFGIQGRNDFSIPGSQLDPMHPQGLPFAQGALDIPGLEQKLYNAALEQGYPTRERVQEIMDAESRFRGQNWTPKSPIAQGMGQQQRGRAATDGYLAARDRRGLGEMM